jgi:large subunit ribosomal protein L25
MEKTLLLKAEIRDKAGTKSAAKLRKQGRIPAIVYGHKEKPVAVSLDAHIFELGLHHGARVLDVQIDGNPQKMIIKDLQYDYLGKDIIHIDLMRVDVSEKIKISVPLEIKGTPKGASEGGVITAHADHIEVECLVTDIPQSLLISVKEMDVGNSLHARDVKLPDNVKLVSNPLMLIVSCNIVIAKTTEEVEAEAPVAPEVITEAKPEEGEVEEEAEKPEKEVKEKEKEK